MKPPGRMRHGETRGGHPMKKSIAVGALAFAALLSPMAQAGLDLPLLYSQGAVLQRDQPIRVWGWDAPGSKVTLAFDGTQAVAMTDEQGHWQATLPAHAAGGPYVLSIGDGHEQRHPARPRRARAGP